MTAPLEMRAWRLESPNNAIAKMHLTTIPRPSPESLKQGEILVRTTAAGINPADYKAAALGLASKMIVAFPETLGMDLSGEVVAVAPGVTGVKSGDAVIGRLDPTGAPGSLAEFAVLGQDAYAVLETTDRDIIEAAAGAPTAALTAYQTIHPYVKSGDRVFLNGGSGGTGTFGIQIAKLLGCHVTVSCSTSKIPLCKDLGADEIIDYTKTDVKAALAEIGPVFALAVDNVGSSPPYLHSASGSYLLPGKAGTFVIVGGSPSAANLKNTLTAKLVPSALGGGSHAAVVFLTKNIGEDLARVAGWIAKGELKVVVTETFGLEKADEAYRKLEEGSVDGKIIVRVKGEGDQAEA